MKNIIHKLFTGLALLSLAALAACSDDDTDPQVPQIGSYDPIPDEAGEEYRVYEGDVLTIYGRNLDLITSVTFGEEEYPAEITEKNDLRIKLTIPLMEEIKEEIPYATGINLYTGSSKFFTLTYYISGAGDKFWPVSVSSEDDAPTIGDVLYLDGYKLDQALNIVFTDTESGRESKVDRADFLSQSEKNITFKIPQAPFTPGGNTLNVTVNASDQSRTLPSLFTVYAPNVDPLRQPDVAPILGSTIELTGEYLGLISSVNFGDYPLTTFAPEGGSMTVRFPLDIPEHNPIITTADIVCYYGEPAQALTLATGYRLDTTPQESTDPVAASIDSPYGSDRFYLNSTATITGNNLEFVSALKVGDFNAVINTNRQTRTSLEFTVPEDFDFTTAQTVPVYGEYEGEMFHFGDIKVYPFYFYKGLKMGLSSNGSNGATADGTNNAATILTEGRVIPTIEIFSPPYLDPFVYSGTQVDNSKGQYGAMANASCVFNPSVITGANDYYSVPPYIFACTNSSLEIRLTGAGSGSGSNYRYLRVWNSAGTGFTQNPGPGNATCWGTPMITFRNLLDSSAEAAWAEGVRNGSLENLIYDGAVGTRTDMEIRFGDKVQGEDNYWDVNSVLTCHYLKYEVGTTGNGSTNLTLADVCQTGFIHITELTCVDANNKAGADRPSGAPIDSGGRTGFIFFDLYWPKHANK